MFDVGVIACNLTSAVTAACHRMQGFTKCANASASSWSGPVKTIANTDFVIGPKGCDSDPYCGSVPARQSQASQQAKATWPDVAACVIGGFELEVCQWASHQ